MISKTPVDNYSGEKWMTSDNRQISMEKKAYVQNVKKKIVNYPDDAERK